MHRLLSVVLLVLAFAPSAHPASESTSRWIHGWITAPQLVEPHNLPPPPGLADRALRQEVQLTLGGEALRVTVSNHYGDAPLRLDGAWVARSLGKGVQAPESARPLAFDGAPGLTLAPGQTRASDPVPLAVAPFDRLAVTLRIATTPERVTGHPGARTSSYLAAPEHTTAIAFPDDATRVERWYFLTGIEVNAPASAAAVVVLGDSIADGRGSTTDGHDRWPDRLARRLAAAHPGLAVLNQGIGGNRVLRDGLGPHALSRLERDVLTLPGVRWLILHEGVNDLGADAKADELIAAYREIIRLARARSIRVYGGTILPFGGSFYDKPGREAERQTLNRWIRESGAFDRVIDFDAAARDPQNPARLAPAFDGGDHLHPSPEGYRLLAEAIDLALFAESN